MVNLISFFSIRRYPRRMDLCGNSVSVRRSSFISHNPQIPSPLLFLSSIRPFQSIFLNPNFHFQLTFAFIPPVTKKNKYFMLFSQFATSRTTPPRPVRPHLLWVRIPSDLQLLWHQYFYFLSVVVIISSRVNDGFFFQTSYTFLVPSSDFNDFDDVILFLLIFCASCNMLRHL